ncbi:MAG: pyridoxal-phosphate dependent enzyme [Myxococcales bacterium]|nr:pyridoxal-phosphate dependent enzyme [Myxococcales bacterium]
MLLRCAGCGTTLSPEAAAPFVCPNRGADDADHIIERQLTLPQSAGVIDEQATHPFMRYRARLSSFAVWQAAGRSAAAFDALVMALDDAVAAVDGRGFARSPWQPLTLAAMPEAASPTTSDWTVHAKLELHGVAGSHKARHLFGLMLWLRVQEALGRLPTRPNLAIASCGNAALAAAVVARAADWPISVFVPTDASAAVLQRLAALQAEIVVCERQPGVPGDPTVNRFREAVQAGALPFCCQGTDNGLTIEGGETLGWELAEHIAATGDLDTLWVQVGGGALGTGCWSGLQDAQSAGVIDGLPRLMTVQTRGAWPLGRAWLRAVGRLLGRPEVADLDLSSIDMEQIATTARDAQLYWQSSPTVSDLDLRQNWRQHMAPWPTTPHSVAHGILDDETYDGRRLVAAMLASGGWPVVASEDALTAAVDALNPPHPVTATGAAGFAGLLQVGQHADAAQLVGKRHAVLLTGIVRA